MTVTIPAIAPAWFSEYTRSVQNVESQVYPVMAIKVYPLATLPAAANYWKTKVGFQETGGIAVQATGGVTWCLSDGTNWIDMQTGSAVA
jgi:hypothetical protein|tara:strand:+ start:2505 stop:2771 length:267 start_codon:yes stop_codon:yes gene_type:complete